MKKFGNINIIIRVYLLAIALFFIFRLGLFFSQWTSLEFSNIDNQNILPAFIMGLRFDIVITGYIMALPALVLLIMDVFKLQSAWAKRILFYFLIIVFSLAFLICAADIPYFSEFYTRFSVNAFKWIDSPVFVFKMIAQEPKFILLLIPLALLIILFYKALKRIFGGQYVPLSQPILRIIILLLSMGLIFLGIRGRTSEQSPIRVGTAYFCNNSFLNQLGLNPVFTLIRSALDARDSANDEIKLMQSDKAFAIVKDYLEITENGTANNIARKVVGNQHKAVRKSNVIFIIMESMSAAKMTRHGNTKKLTPFLDSLSKEATYFNNIYTAGLHTYNGIFSTLFSYPALYAQHHLKNIHQYNGINSELEKHGYTSTYFTTHDAQFDNAAGFLIANGFDQVISQPDYPANEVKTIMGVPDDYMFRYALPVLDSLHALGKPFFTAFMTGSDHVPYYVPEYFTPKNKEPKDAVVEYADWSLRQFIKQASSKKWFDNTLFVFMADHGKPIDPKFYIPLNFFHSPLVFFSPRLLPQAELNHQVGGQIDIFPTTMSLLNLPYLNNTLGTNLFNKNNPYTVMNYDSRIGIVDSSLLLVLDQGGAKIMYKYKTGSTADVIDKYPLQEKAMRDYAHAFMQVHQEKINSRKTFYKESE